MRKNYFLFPLLATALLSGLMGCSSYQSPNHNGEKTFEMNKSKDTSSKYVLANASSVPSNTAPIQTGSNQNDLIPFDKASSLIKQSSHDAMVAVKTFDPHVNGFTGVVVAPQASLNQAMTTTGFQASGNVNSQINWDKVPRQIVFIANQSDVIAPQLLDNQGKLINENLMLEQGITKSYSDGLSASAAPSAHGFIAGTKGPIMTVFMDPNCIYCHLLFIELEPHIAKGDLRVRFIMVGFLKPDSRPKSATILAASSPYQLLRQDEKGFNKAKEEGGIKPLANPDPKLLAIVDSNTQLMNSIAQVGTPMMLFCDKNTGKVDIMKGYPQDLNGLISRLSETGHPACK